MIGNEKELNFYLNRLNGHTAWQLIPRKKCNGCSAYPRSEYSLKTMGCRVLSPSKADL